jgi:hypothetical protein
MRLPNHGVRFAPYPGNNTPGEEADMQEIVTETATDGILSGILGSMIIFWILSILATVFWIWMLIDVVTSSLGTNEKILWFLIFFFLHILGAVIYLAVGRPKRLGTAH